MKIFLFLLFFTAISQSFARTVLVIGDSHSVGPFGWALDENLRADGNHVYTVASCGSIPGWWYSGKQTPCGFYRRDLKGTKFSATKAATPIITELLNDVKPETVILEFGGNYLNLPSDSFVINDIRKIIASIKNSGAKCFWITHPDTRANRSAIPRIGRLIKEAIGESCPVFESYLVTRYPESGGDGTHYWFSTGTPLAKKWAMDAFLDYKKHE